MNNLEIFFEKIKNKNLENSEDLSYIKKCANDLKIDIFNDDNSINLNKFINIINNPEIEKYGLNWNGKNNCKKLIYTESNATLIPKKEESIDFEDTNNILIKGENLEVLKILNKNYYNKIKFIYIDPPYNTGNDFIYPDKYKNNKNDYLESTGQMRDGVKLTSNPETDGAFHTNWLNMMYPRLSLAKKLLKDDGFIFISIDDHELDNLLKIGKEIFGENNYVGLWNWVRSSTPNNSGDKIKKNIEYILCFSKKPNNIKFKGIKKDSKSDDPFTKNNSSIKELKFPPNTIYINKNDGLINAGIYGTDKFPNKLLDDLIIENKTNKNQIRFENKFVWTQSKLEEEIKNGTKINLSDILVLSYKKAFYSEEVPPNIIDARVCVETNEIAGSELEKLFGGIRLFDYPKPISLIKYLINFCCNKEDIILDFFAGSGTTAQAVMELNKEDKGNRNWILVQIDELIDKKQIAYNHGYKNIFQITKDRIIKSIDKIKNVDSEYDGDLGFKLFELNNSNFHEWNGTNIDNEDILRDRLKIPLLKVDDNNKLSIIYEILIIEGYNLNIKISKFNYNNYEYYSINNNELIICLENSLDEEIIDELIKKTSNKLYLLDVGFNGNDSFKINTKLKADYNKIKIEFL